MRKIVLIIIISSLIFSSSGILSRPAKAIIPVSVDIDPFSLGSWVEIVVSAAKDIAMDLVRNFKEILRDTIVKRILDAMVDDVVQWIQGGGEPKFVTDFGGFMEDAFQAGVGDVAKKLGMAWLCSPFKDQLLLSVSYAPVERFSQRVECTLDDIVKNINDFYANFENGGWIAYNEIWKPQNNFYGVTLMVHDEMLASAAAKQKAAETEVIAGAGFLGQKKCVQKDEQAIYDCLAAFSSSGNSEDTDASDKEYCESQAPCLKEEITTPGDTIGKLAADAMGNDINNYIPNVKSYVAAIVNAIINRLMKEGLSAMKGSTSNGGTSYSAKTVGYGDVVSQDLNNQKQELKSEYEKFLGEKQYILNSKNQSLSSTEQTLQTLQYIKNNCLTCLPQPTGAEIQSVQSEVDRLRAETIGLQSTVTELNGLIANINAISPDNRDREMVIVMQQRDAFEAKYDTSTLYQDILTGDKRNAADSEKTDKQNALVVTQNRLNACNIMKACQTATSTQP